MIGVEVLSWGTKDSSTYNPFLKPLLAWQFGGSTGHAAIKLCLPLSFSEAVKKYCSSEDNPQLIPHYPSKIQVPDGQGGVTEQDVLVVYFSMWPGRKTRFEHQDKLCSIYATKGSNKPELKLEPDQLKIHSNQKSNARAKWEKILGLQSVVDLLSGQFEAKTDEFHRLDWKLTSLMLDSEFSDEIAEEYAEIKLKLSKLVKEIGTLEEKLKPFEDKLNILLERYFAKYLKKFAKPDHTAFIPFKGGQNHGLSPLAMLIKMRELIESDFEFHFYFNNCSNFVREAMLSGINPELREELTQNGILSDYDLSLALFDAPIRVMYTANQLQSGIKQLNEMHLLDSVLVPEDRVFLPQSNRHGQSKQPAQNINRMDARPTGRDSYSRKYV